MFVHHTTYLPTSFFPLSRSNTLHLSTLHSFIHAFPFSKLNPPFEVFVFVFVFVLGKRDSIASESSDSYFSIYLCLILDI